MTPLHQKIAPIPNGPGAPEAILACMSALAAEAFEGGHIRAARVLAQTAALLTHAELWRPGPER